MRRLLLTAAVLVAADLSAQPALQPLGTYSTGLFDEGAAEVVDYDPATRRAFFVNADAGEVQALDLSDPASPTLAFTIDDFAGTPNSVAVSGAFVAVAVEAPVSTDPGEVRFYQTDGTFVQAVTVGALPDAVAFSETGQFVVVANEGEPDDGVDPEGSVSIIDVQNMTLSTVGFADFNEDGPRFGELDGSVLLDPNAASVAQDFEPEYVATVGTTAFVTLQEANAVAEIDLPTGTLTGIYGLGLKDYGAAGNGIDPSDRDGGVDIRTVPVLGARQPDAIAAFEEGGVVYFVTANEGDARDGDEERVGNLTLDPTAFPDAAALQEDENLGRLEVRPSAGDTDGDGDQDRLVAFGGRSVTVYRATGGGAEVVFDSGDAFEQVTAQRFPGDFNSDNDENDSFDSRSDAKGPEPEAVTLGVVDGRRYAFVGLERIGGVVTYDLTDPAAPVLVGYVNNRDFSVEAEVGGMTNPAVGDLGPEGLAFVSAADSPTGAPLLIVANEVSGTVTTYAVGTAPTPLSPAAPLAVGDFDTDGEGDPRGEFVEVTNTSGGEAVDLSGGSFVVFNPFTERVTFSAAPRRAGRVRARPGRVRRRRVRARRARVGRRGGRLPRRGPRVRPPLGRGGRRAARVRPRRRAPPGGARGRRARRPRGHDGAQPDARPDDGRLRGRRAGRRPGRRLRRARAPGGRPRRRAGRGGPPRRDVRRGRVPGRRLRRPRRGRRAADDARDGGPLGPPRPD